MSCCPPSVVPDFSDNGGGGGGGGGVQSVNAGTGISITGTAIDPVINNSLVGVSALEGLQGSINLVGVGCSVSATSTTDITINVPVPPVAPVSSVAGATGAITMTGTGCTISGAGSAITINVPVPPVAPVSSVAGASGAITMTGTGCTISGGGSAITIDVPVPPVATVQNITGTAPAITISQPTTGTFNVENTGVNTITAGTNCTITGTPQNPIISTSGVLGVNTIATNPAPSAIGLAITGTAGDPIINLKTSTFNSYFLMNGQTGSGGLDFPNGATSYFDIFPPSPFFLDGVNYTSCDIDLNITIQGTGNFNFGSTTLQFGFIWGNAGMSSGVPSTLFGGNMVNATGSTYTFNLGYCRVPASDLTNPPAGTNQLYLYMTNTSTTPTVAFSIVGMATNHRATFWI
jgi:hypothetical protein